MREIKFRAWFKGGLNGEKEAKMTDEFDFSDFDGEYFIPEGCYLVNMEIMQFTGLKDKNGKEIYEGDILDNEGARQKYEVIFHNGCFCISQGGIGYHIFNEKKVEVIGNIYENKDLLE